MLLYLISALINAVTSIILGITVYLKNKAETLNRVFALFCLSVASWGFFYFLWIIFGNMGNAYRLALIFGRALNISAIFISITYFHFITLFLNIYRRKKRLVNLGYLASFFLFLSGFTSLFVKDVKPELSFLWYPKPGITYHIFTFIFFGYILYSWYLMYDALKRNIGTANLQIKYVLAGTLIGFIGGSTSFLPVYGVPIPPFAIGLVVVAVIFITLAILRYHLFEIRVVLTEVLVAATALTLLVQAVTAETFALKVLGVSLLGFFSVFGYQLIQSVIREIELREKLAKVNIQLEEANVELKKLDKAKTEFLSIASHQLRTPLGIIKGYISMILESSYGKVPKDIKQPLENVYTSNKGLVKLVDDLLDVSKIEMGKMELELAEVSVEDMISEIVTGLRLKTEEKKLYLKFEKPPVALPKISIDREKIKNVVMNVIDNAIKYTKKGGVTAKCKIVDGRLQIEVKDTGPGMEKDELEKIFKPLARGTAGVNKGGAGLGLYVARKFVEIHEGRVWAESEGKGKGSTFYVELPIK